MLRYPTRTLSKLSQCLEEWQLLSFKIFPKDNEYVNEYKQILQEEELDDEHDIYINYSLSNSSFIFNKMEDLFLYRHIGNKISFNKIWMDRFCSYVPNSFVKNVFEDVYVPSEVLDTMSDTSVIELAKYRYTSQYQKFVSYFEMNTSVVLSAFVSNEIISIVLHFLQPKEFKVNK